MSSFCGGTGNVPAMTLAELREIYTGGILPPDMPPMQSGLAPEEWVMQFVRGLEADGRLPRSTRAQEVQSVPFDSPETKDPLADFVEKEVALQNKIKAEYCHYEKRYFAALDSFLSSLADASLRGGDASTVNTKLDITRVLNQKLTLLAQIVNGISKYRYADTSKFQSDINSLNENLRSRQKRLAEQNKILQKETAAADLHKKMVDYTVEKNKANANLLTLYGVLNIVAIGMIFYIAKTT